MLKDWNFGISKYVSERHAKGYFDINNICSRLMSFTSYKHDQYKICEIWVPY